MRRLLMVILSIAVILGLVFGLVGGVFATDKSYVINTAHDLAIEGEAACLKCHTPHNAQGDYLFSRDVGEEFSGVKAMCYSCHDGTTTSTGIYVFDGTIITAAKQHPFPADGPKSITPITDCNSCHDPHGVAPGVEGRFLISDNPSNLGANMCRNCHTEAIIGTKSHPINEDATVKGYTPTTTYSVTSPNLTSANFTPGARLFYSAAELTESANVTSGDYLKCLSCHAAHGSADNDTMTSNDPVGPGKTSPLCQTCH